MLGLELADFELRGSEPALEQVGDFGWPLLGRVEVGNVARRRIQRHTRAARAAVQLMDGHAQRLAAQVVQRHVDAADGKAVAERRVPQALPQPPRIPHWILIHNKRRQHLVDGGADAGQRVRLAPANQATAGFRAEQ